MQQTELIVAYIRGELTETQLRDFEQRLLAEPALQAKVKDYQVILQGLKGLQHEAFHREVAGWELEDRSEKEQGEIMAYLTGEMGEEDKIIFKTRLTVDPELARKLGELRPLAEGFKAMRHEGFENEVKGWANGLTTKKTKPAAKVVPLAKRRNQWWRYAAAAILLALIAVAFWQLGPSLFGEQDLTAFQQQNYIAPAAAVERGSKTMLEEGVTAFEKGNYTLAVSALQSITAEDSLFVTAQYYLGHAQFKMERYREATAAFSQSLDAVENGRTYQLGDFNADNAGWTRVLAQLAQSNGQDDTVLYRLLAEFLDQADRTDVYYQKALELEERLK